MIKGQSSIYAMMMMMIMSDTNNEEHTSRPSKGNSYCMAYTKYFSEVFLLVLCEYVRDQV